MQRKPPTPALVKQTGLFEEEGGAAGALSAEEGAARPALPPRPALPNIQEIIRTRGQQPAASALGAEERPWLQPNLVVRCVNGELAGGSYSGRLGVVQRTVEGGFGGEVRMVESLDVLVLDQDDCRPTLPPLGAALKVVAGPYAGGLGRYAEAGPSGKDVVVEVAQPRDMQGRVLALPLAHVCNFIP